MREAGAISVLVKIMQLSALESAAVLDKAASAIAYLSGHTSAGQRERKFRIGEHVLTVTEAPFSEAGLGWETWNSAVVFSQWIAKNAHLIYGKRVIELGCGTALCGLVRKLIGSFVAH